MEQGRGRAEAQTQSFASKPSAPFLSGTGLLYHLFLCDPDGGVGITVLIYDTKSIPEPQSFRDKRDLSGLIIKMKKQARRD